MSSDGSSLPLSGELSALIYAAARDGLVRASELWDAVVVQASSRSVVLPPEARPAYASIKPPAVERFAEAPTDGPADVALRLSRFLAFHYEDDQVETGHLAVALAGLPDPLARMGLMQAVAESWFGAKLVALHVILPRFDAPDTPLRRDRPGLGLRAGFRARRDWNHRFPYALTAFNRGHFDEAIGLVRQLVHDAERASAPPLELTFLCEIGANAALHGPADLGLASQFCEQGLTFTAALAEPVRALTRGRLLQRRALIAFNLGDLRSTEVQLRDSQAALATCAAHPSVRLPSVAPKLLDAQIDDRLIGVQLLHALGRWDDALDLAGAAAAAAEQQGARGKAMLALTAVVVLLREVGAERRLREALDHLSTFDAAVDLNDVHPTMRVGVLSDVTEAEVWLAERGGDLEGAAESLNQALVTLGPAPEAWNTSRSKRVRLLAKLGDVYLRLGDLQAAMAVVRQVEPEEVLRTQARGEVLGFWTCFLRDQRRHEDSVRALEDFDRLHGPSALTPQETVEVVSAVARDAAVIGEPGRALAYLERVTAAMAWLTGGRLPAGIRSSLLGARGAARDISLRTSSDIAFADMTHAGRLAMQCADAWRETTLASTVGSDLGPLPPAVRKLVAEIEKVTAALRSRPPDSGGLPVQPGAIQAAHLATAARLSDLRDQLGQQIGLALSQLLVPAPRSPAPIATTTGEALLSVTPLADGSELVTSWQLPDGSTGVVTTSISPAVVSMLGQLSDGLSFQSLDDVEEWQDEWTSAQEQLAAAILPRQLREWLTSSDAPTVRYALDGFLGNVPVSALPLDESSCLNEVAAVNRVPFLRSAGRRSYPMSPRPRVLAFHYRTPAASRERAHLDRLHDRGRIALTSAERLTDVASMLAEAAYDVLILTCHGSGRGLDFRFHDEKGDQLVTHQLLDLRVPPLVVAAACFSGTEGAVDITGLSATLLSRGAQTVMTGNWALPDEETAEVLISFYELMGSPGSPAEHLRQAQNKMKDHATALWAGLTCTTL